MVALVAGAADVSVDGVGFVIGPPPPVSVAVVPDVLVAVTVSVAGVCSADLLPPQARAVIATAKRASVRRMGFG